MKNPANIILGVIVMILAAVAVYEYTVISSLKEEVKAKELNIEALTLHNRNLYKQIQEKDTVVTMVLN